MKFNLEVNVDLINKTTAEYLGGIVFKQKFIRKVLNRHPDMIGDLAGYKEPIYFMDTYDRDGFFDMLVQEILEDKNAYVPMNMDSDEMKKDFWERFYSALKSSKVVDKRKTREAIKNLEAKENV